MFKKMLHRKLIGVLAGAFLLFVNVKSQSCQLNPFNHQPLIIRPKPLLKPPIFLPLADLLKRARLRFQNLVKPAVLPPPVYFQSNPQTMVASASAKLAAAAQLLGQSAQMVPPAKGIDVSLAYQPVLPPADVVSLAIAYRPSNHGYTGRIFENKLNYGFRKLPIDESVAKPKVNKNILPEKNLYDLNGPVVELKPVAEQQETCDDLAEAAEEELLDVDVSDEVAAAVSAVKQPSLAELGYGPATASPDKLVEYPGLVAGNQGCVFA